MLTRIAPYLVAGAALVTLPAVARAQDAIPENAANEDFIRLNDGATVRGHVILEHPGCDLTVLRDDGVSTVVPWAHIVSMTGPSFSVGPRTMSGPHRDDETDFLTPGPGRVPLEIQSTGREMVLSLSNGFIARDEVCLTPCTLYVRPRLLTVHASGLHVARTDTRIEVPAEGLHVRLRAPSSTVAGVSALLIALGSAALVGATVLVVDGVSNRDGAFEAGGAGVGIGGAAMLIGGIALGASQPMGVESARPGTTLQASAPRWSFNAQRLPAGMGIGVVAVF